MRLLGFEDPAGEHQLLRAGRADEARQEPARADVACRQADADERRVELRRACGEADVGAEHEGEATTGGGAVDRGDHRLRQRAQVRDQRGDVLLHRERRPASDRGARCAGAAAVAAEVEAGAEAASRAREDHHTRDSGRRRSRRGGRAATGRARSVIAFNLSGRLSVSWTMPARRSGRRLSIMAASCRSVPVATSRGWNRRPDACGRSAHTGATCSVRSTSPRCPSTSAARSPPHGRKDPTTLPRSPGARREFWRATLTPEGPGTLHLRWGTADVDVDGVGPGGRVAAGRVRHARQRRHRSRSARSHRASSTHSTAPASAPSRTAPAASTTSCCPRSSPSGSPTSRRIRQWRRLCLELGGPAPGPNPGLRLPPRRTPAGQAELVVPPARHRAQAGGHVRRGRPGTPTGSWQRADLPPAAAAASCGCIAASASGRSAACWHGVGRPRRGGRRRLPPEEPRRVRPRRQGPRARMNGCSSCWRRTRGQRGRVIVHCSARPPGRRSSDRAAHPADAALVSRGLPEPTTHRPAPTADAPPRRPTDWHRHDDHRAGIAYLISRLCVMAGAGIVAAAGGGREAPERPARGVEAAEPNAVNDR